MGHFDLKEAPQETRCNLPPFSTLHSDSYVQPQNSFKKKDHLINSLCYLATKGVLFASLVRELIGTLYPLQVNMTNSWLVNIKESPSSTHSLGAMEGKPLFTSWPHVTPLQENSHGPQF